MDTEESLSPIYSTRDVVDKNEGNEDTHLRPQYPSSLRRLRGHSTPLTSPKRTGP